MAVVVTNLATQVQDRIDNLSGTETLEQLLVLRKAADNLSLDLTDIEAAISAKIAALDSTSDDESLLIANRAASLSTAAGGSGNIGLKVAPTTSYSSTNGGLFGSSVLGIDINTKSTVLTLTGKWVVYHITAAGLGTTNNLFISLSIDGRSICSDLDTARSNAAISIYAASSGSDTTLAAGAGVMPPLLVEQSLTLQLQKTGATAATLYFLAIPLED